MIHHRSVFVFFALLFAIHGLAQNLYNKKFHSTGSSVYSTSHTSTLDGGACTVVRAPTSTDNNLRLIKTDIDGNTEWIQCLDWPNSYGTPTIIQGPDSCYLLVTTRPHGSSGSTYVYLKLNPACDSILFHNCVDIPYPGPYELLGRGVCIARNDGTYLISGTLTTGLAGTFAWHIFNVSATGQINWSHFYNVNTYKVALADMDTCDNGDIVIGGMWGDAFSMGCIVTRISSAGSVVWSKHFIGSFISEVCGTRNNGCALIQGGPSVTMLDSTGAIEWTAGYTSNPTCTPLLALRTADGGVFVSGEVAGYHGFGMKFDSTGSVYSIHKYDSIYPTSLFPHPVAGFTISGYMLQAQHGLLLSVKDDGTNCMEESIGFVPALIQTTIANDGNDTVYNFNIFPDSINFSTDSIQETMRCFLNSVSEIPGAPIACSIFPNPARNQFTITSEQVMEEISVFNTLGQLQVRIKPASAETTVNTEQFASGVYLIHIHFENHIESRLLVIE